MQFTLIGRNRKTGETKVTQYGTSHRRNDNGLSAAIEYAQRIWQDFDEHEALVCQCENNGDLCNACEVFETYKSTAAATFAAEKADGII